MKKSVGYTLVLVLLLSFGLSAMAAEPAAEPQQPSMLTIAAAELPGAKLPTDDQMTAISKRIENPVNKISSLPFTYQVFTGTGLNSTGTEDNLVQNQLYLKPVIPFLLNKDWMFISRTVIPIEISTPNYTNQGAGPSSGYTSGIGNITLSGFLTPRDQDSKLLWGIGPVVSTPTATNLSTGNFDWGLGPTVMAVYRSGPWVVGSIINNVWSVGSTTSTENKLDWQVFAHYNLSNGWAISTSPEIYANWTATTNDNRYTLPLGLGVSKTFKIGEQICNAGIQEYYYALHPNNGPEYMTQFSFTLVFPDYSSK